MSKWYLNCHSHSMGSLLDGISKPVEYAEKVVEDGGKAMLFTDHGNLHSLLNAYKAAEAVGLKYFAGMEAYQARTDRFCRDDNERASGGPNEWGQKGPHHLGIIAYNNEGYHNLLKISSRAYLEGYYVKPRIDFELLNDHKEGLVILSGCLSGMVQQALTRGDENEALNIAATLQEIVGRENFFIEVMRHGIDLEENNYPKLIELGKTLNAPIIASCDSHYTRKEHATSHDLCLCINTGARIDTPDRFAFTGEYHLKTYEEMAELFPEEYLDNTMLIYEKHDFKLEFGKYHIPNFPVPDGKSQTDDFIEKTYAGAVYRFGDNWRENKAVEERLEFEVGVITDMGFPNYFLIVADIVGWARDNGIMTGAGRGSVAGSIVAYCMQITEVNPLKHDLPFERFLVPGRKTVPDIDLDFDDRYRDQVIEYTRSKYGYDHTAYIGTFSEIGAKTAVKDVSRVMNRTFEFGKKINDAMPPATFGVTKTLTECLNTNDFYKLYSTDPEVEEVIDASMDLEGVWRHVGVHAAGLVVCDRPVIEYVPVMQKGEGQPIITQWDMEMVDKMGLIKIDFLGLRNLSIVDKAFELIEATGEKKFPKNRYELVDENDPKVFEALSRGENVGVFQMESPGIRQLMVSMKPESINDISALLALYRPGPMGSNVHNEYVARKNKKTAVTYLHPALQPILKETYGLLLYQEQILRICWDINGFSVGEADDLRKVVGKKLVKEMPKHRKAFVEGAIQTTKFSDQIANQLFSDIEHHASYSFSKNHAVAYAYTSYLTSYLRTYYPLEFLAAALSSVGNKEDRLRLYLNECKRMGYEVTPPSISKSGVDFTVEDGKILYGFNAVKGVGEVLAGLLGDKDAVRDYKNIYDFLRRVDTALLNRDTVNHFLSAGCFDELLLEMDIPQKDLTRSQKMGMLQGELAELGVFLSDHPFTDAQDLTAGKTTHTIEELNEGTPGQKVKVAGVVIDIKGKMTKAGKKMWHLIIDDLHASIPVSIMPKQAAEMADPPFLKGDIINVDGRLDKVGDDENAAITLLAFQIEKLDDSSLVGGNPIHLFATRELSYEQLNRLYDIIDSADGNSPVYLEYLVGNTTVKIKFDKLTSKDKEEILQKLIEV